MAYIELSGDTGTLFGSVQTAGPNRYLNGTCIAQITAASASFQWADGGTGTLTAWVDGVKIADAISTSAAGSLVLFTTTGAHVVELKTGGGVVYWPIGQAFTVTGSAPSLTFAPGLGKYIPLGSDLSGDALDSHVRRHMVRVGNAAHDMWRWKGTGITGFSLLTSTAPANIPMYLGHGNYQPARDGVALPDATAGPEYPSLVGSYFPHVAIVDTTASAGAHEWRVRAQTNAGVTGLLLHGDGVTVPTLGTIPDERECIILMGTSVPSNTGSFPGAPGGQQPLTNTYLYQVADALDCEAVNLALGGSALYSHRLEDGTVSPSNDSAARNPTVQGYLNAALALSTVCHIWDDHVCNDQGNEGPLQNMDGSVMSPDDFKNQTIGLYDDAKALLNGSHFTGAFLVGQTAGPYRHLARAAFSPAQAAAVAALNTAHGAGTAAILADDETINGQPAYNTFENDGTHLTTPGHQQYATYITPQVGAGTGLAAPSVSLDGITLSHDAADTTAKTVQFHPAPVPSDASIAGHYIVWGASTATASVPISSAGLLNYTGVAPGSLITVTADDQTNQPNRAASSTYTVPASSGGSGGGGGGSVGFTNQQGLTPGDFDEDFDTPGYILVDRPGPVQIMTANQNVYTHKNPIVGRYIPVKATKVLLAGTYPAHSLVLLTDPE